MENRKHGTCFKLANSLDVGAKTLEKGTRFFLSPVGLGIGIGGFCTGQAEESDLLHDARLAR